MLKCLFIITIVYEVVQTAFSMYKIRAGKWTEAETNIVPDEETRKASGCLGGAISMLLVAGAIFAIFIGGPFAIKAGAVYGILCALGVATYLYSYACGRNLSLVYAIYNFIMMVLFIREACAGGIL